MISVSDINKTDYDLWVPLWNANNQGQENKDVTDTTWERLIDQSHGINGLVAKKDGEMVGLLHYILHPVTGHIENVCYMQDVFVKEKYRRQGIAKKLIEHLRNIGTKEKWARIYWLAEADNIAAQKLYKDIGLKLNFTLHVMPL
jgi:ribosomal protein S18 acetylase RimI-like enzyme